MPPATVKVTKRAADTLHARTPATGAATGSIDIKMEVRLFFEFMKFAIFVQADEQEKSPPAATSKSLRVRAASATKGSKALELAAPRVRTLRPRNV
jgi:hypothetical protein